MGAHFGPFYTCIYIFFFFKLSFLAGVVPSSPLEVPPLPFKRKRSVLLRDGRCEWGGGMEGDEGGVRKMNKEMKLTHQDFKE